MKRTGIIIATVVTSVIIVNQGLDAKFVLDTPGTQIYETQICVSTALSNR